MENVKLLKKRIKLLELERFYSEDEDRAIALSEQIGELKERLALARERRLEVWNIA